MDTKYLKDGYLLDQNGNLSEAGFAKSLVKIYRRDDVKTNHLKIKEWDYYFIGNENFGIALTIADNSYMSLVGATFFNFQKNFEHSKNVMRFMSRGKLHLPTDSRGGDIIYENKKASFKFLHEDSGKRHLQVRFPSFFEKKDLRADIYLEETLEDTMVIATPFLKPKHFYYNQKINLLKASGYMKLGDEHFDFLDDSFGVLDWGRGVWTYKNTWYWSSMSDCYNNHLVGFNLGYGFGDTSKATENVFYYDNVQYKLNDVKFDIPLNSRGGFDYMKPWKIRSSSGDIDLTFEPMLDRRTRLSALIIKQHGDQVFGKFKGRINVDDKSFYIEDVFGFAERVTNYW